MTETPVNLERMPELQAPRWTREALEGRQPSDETYSVAFDVLLAPRRAWLRAWGDPTVLLLGQAAFERWRRTGSVDLSDYLTIGDGLEPMVRCPPDSTRRGEQRPHLGGFP